LVLTGYLIAPEGLAFFFLVLLIITGGFIVNSYLGFAATNRFRIYYFGLGPTEMRLLFIIINTVIIFTGTDHFTYTVPLACAVSLIALIVTVFHTGDALWKIDMENNK
jgi:hypothetical protein